MELYFTIKLWTEFYLPWILFGSLCILCAGIVITDYIKAKFRKNKKEST